MAGVILNPESEAESSSVPKTMAEALDFPSPEEALLALSQASEAKARRLSLELMTQLDELMGSLDKMVPPVLSDLPSKTGDDDKAHPIETSVACADSIHASLTKIASGGTQASQDIRQLEEEKREMEQHAQDVETALALRNISESAAEGLNTQRYDVAAKGVMEYTEQARLERHTERALTYAGTYTVQQIETTKQVLRKTLLEKYEAAVNKSDLRALGELTPLLQMVQLEKEGVALYLRYLQAVMATEWKEHGNQDTTSAPPFTQMARIYNHAVQTLRHHLPMVSYCLAKADGDAAVVQLVHVQVEQNVVPMFQAYITDRQLATLAMNAQRIYTLLEERYVNLGRMDMIEHSDPESAPRGADRHAEDMSDCGFSVEVGSLADVDASMEEAALCLQHAESYVRFLRHTVDEVNKARELRHKADAEQRRLHRERQEWSTGVHLEDDSEDEDYTPIEIIPSHTQLHEVVAEVGGYYSGIERCLLLASMQRAFTQVSTSEVDLRQYSPLGITGHGTGIDRPASRALKTSLVETCLYATRRSTQRAFATGHTGTAAAMANFGSDCLGGVLLEVMSRRAEEFGVACLKPGEGLLEGSSGLFGNAVMASANMIRRGAPVGAHSSHEDDGAERVRIEQGIACACANLNDLEVAVHHTQQLEKMLTEAIEKGFPPNSHDTEQLRMCVKSLSPVTQRFRAASNGAVDSLVSVMENRVRSIVSDAVGVDGAASGIASGSFMGSTVIGAGNVVDRSVVRMNYNLDDAAYELLQLSEGYMARLCSSLDELIRPLRIHLEPGLSDKMILGVLGSASKRIEAALRRCKFTALGALSLDSDMRDLLSYSKDRLDSPELTSNVALYRACVPLSRLIQIAKLLNVDDLEDVLDLISGGKRKGNWELKLDDAKAFLGLRVEFESRKVNELLSASHDKDA